MEIEGAEELGRLAAQEPEHVRNREFFNPTSTILANAVHALHTRSFFHGDLNARNVLIRETEGIEVFLFDSPNGRHWFFPFREFRLIKDLSALDSDVREVLSRTQRLQFYLAYARQRRLSPRDKRRIKRIVARSMLPRNPINSDVKSYIESDET